ncbi:unnamed protein product [Parajaminaea phylloscopi]
MKFTVAPIALALIAAAGVLAQEPASSASNTAASASSSAPASSSSSSSSAAPTSASSGGSGGAGGSSGGSASACNALPGYDEGTVRVPDYGCPYTTTTTPTYDSMKLQSYLIGGHSRGPEGKAISEVASDLAKSVVDIYPTLTASFSNIAEQYVTAISASIDAARKNPQLVADSAMNIQGGKIASVAAAAVAVVAGGAFFL